MRRSIFIGRWTPRILFSLQERPHRHGELRRHLGDISQRILTRTLRDLESTGLVARRVMRPKPPCCRVFAEQTRKDNHQAAQRYVPMGETASYGSERRRAPRGSRARGKRQTNSAQIDTRRYTHVPDCAPRAGTGKLDGETRRRRNICARYALQAQL